MFINSSLSTKKEKFRHRQPVHHQRTFRLVYNFPNSFESVILKRKNPSTPRQTPYYVPRHAD